MGCCCSRPDPSEREKEDRYILPITEPIVQQETGNSFGSTLVASTEEAAMSKEDIVNTAVGHLVREPQPERAESPTPAYTRDASIFTPSSTRSSISIPETDVADATLHPDHTDISNPRPSFPSSSSSATPTTPFASLKLLLNDQMTCHGFPPSTISHIRRTIQSQWPKGIQKEEAVDPFDEANLDRLFKLKGNPWLQTPENPTAVGDSVHATRLIKALLNTLSHAGWVLTLSSGSALGLRQHKSTLLFRHQDPAPAPQQWISIATLHIGTLDTLRVLDAPDELTRDLGAALEQAGMTKRHGRTFQGVYEIALGRHRCTQDNVDLPDMMLLMLGALDKHGFTVAAAVDQAGDYGKPDAWYCSRPEGWTAGMPVFHR